MSNATSKASPPPAPLSRDELYTQLEEAWADLAKAGAPVARVSKDCPLDLMSVKLRHEQRRLRSFKER